MGLYGRLRVRARITYIKVDGLYWTPRFDSNVVYVDLRLNIKMTCV